MQSFLIIVSLANCNFLCAGESARSREIRKSERIESKSRYDSLGGLSRPVRLSHMFALHTLRVHLLMLRRPLT